MSVPARTLTLPYVASDNSVQLLRIRQFGRSLPIGGGAFLFQQNIRVSIGGFDFDIRRNCDERTAYSAISGTELLSFIRNSTASLSLAGELVEGTLPASSPDTVATLPIETQQER